MIDVPKYKYNKTFHLPWSLGITNEDKVLTYDELYIDFMLMKDAYISLKLDGECTTIGRGYSHARSLDSKSHWTRNHIKQLASNLINDIPAGWRICGENMMGQHSIRYENLDSFFYVFSIWDENNNRLSLDDMIIFAECLGLTIAPVLGRGRFKDLVKVTTLSIVPRDPLWDVGLNPNVDEGYIISNAGSFHYDDFKKNLAKCVRKNHVQTNEHWMFQGIANQLKPELRGQHA